MNSHEIILKPIYSEKSLSAATLGRYTFKISLSASKGQVRSALKDLFDVDALTVRTLHVKGSSRVVGRRRKKITQPDYKKAMVTLKKGQKITVFELEEKSKDKEKKEKNPK